MANYSGICGDCGYTRMECSCHSRDLGNLSSDVRKSTQNSLDLCHTGAIQARPVSDSDTKRMMDGALLVDAMRREALIMQLEREMFDDGGPAPAPGESIEVIIAWVRQAVYRVGWNDRSRSLIRQLRGSEGSDE